MRLRTSTVVLIIIWVAAFVTWILVRPA